MNAQEARERFASARVARLATVGSDGRPHLVPITFALAEPDIVVTAIDHKPKRTMWPQRLANIASHPEVSLLVDHYEEDWRGLWWVRADGTARVREPGGEADALAALIARYSQYAERPPEGPVILIEVRRWSGWTGA